MTLLTAIMVGVTFACAIFLMLGRDLKSVAIGVFLLAHGANLALISSSRSPVGKASPVLEDEGYAHLVDPLPQALILTAIVIGFAVQAFLLTMLVVTWRRTGTLELDDLAAQASEATEPEDDTYPAAEPAPPTT